MVHPTSMATCKQMNIVPFLAATVTVYTHIYTTQTKRVFKLCNNTPEVESVKERESKA